MLTNVSNIKYLGSVIKGEVICVLNHALCHEDAWVRGCTARPILNLDTRWK